NHRVHVEQRAVSVERNRLDARFHGGSPLSEEDAAPSQPNSPQLIEPAPADGSRKPTSVFLIRFRICMEFTPAKSGNSKVSRDNAPESAGSHNIGEVMPYPA